MLGFIEYNVLGCEQLPPEILCVLTHRILFSALFQVTSLNALDINSAQPCLTLSSPSSLTSKAAMSLGVPCAQLAGAIHLERRLLKALTAWERTAGCLLWGSCPRNLLGILLL